MAHRDAEIRDAVAIGVALNRHAAAGVDDVMELTPLLPPKLRLPYRELQALAVL